MYTPTITSDSLTVTMLQPLLVRTEAPDEVVDRVIRVDGFTRVAPEPVDDVVLHRTAIDEMVVHVSDLQFTTCRWCEARQDVEDRLVVEVDTRHGVRARRLLGFLENANDPIVLELRDAEVSQMRGFFDLGEKDARATFLASESLHRTRNRTLEHVVRQHDDNLVAVREALRQAECFGDSPWAVLVCVQQSIEAPSVSVAKEAQELSRVRSSCDDHRLGDPAAHESLDGVRDHRSVVHGEQVFVGDAGQWIQTTTGPTRQDHAFHDFFPSPGGPGLDGSRKPDARC